MTNVKPELYHAIKSGDLARVTELFEPSDLASNSYEGSLLHAAAKYGTLDIVRFLVDSGAEVNRTPRKPPAITFAAEKGKLDIIRYLLEKEAILDTSNILSNPLVRAAKKGHAKVVQSLLTTDIDPHATYRTPTGALENALTEAESGGHTDVVDLLKAHGCRRPIEGVDKPLWEPPPERMVNQTPEHNRHVQIVEYMEKRFGPADANGMQELLPIVDGMSVSINIIPPNEAQPHLVLFTSGMSALPMKVPDGQEDWQHAELVMYLPPDWVHPKDGNGDPQWMWPLLWLRKMAYHPHLNDSWLGRPAAIVSSADPPEPLGPNTEQTCLLMIPDVSYLKPPLKRADGKLVHFFTLVPLYTEERDYELKHGMKPFLRRFVDKKVPMNVVLDRSSFA